jgi:hypothetical protein
MRRTWTVALALVVAGSACSTPARGDRPPPQAAPAAPATTSVTGTTDTPEPDPAIGSTANEGAIGRAFVVSSVDGEPADATAKRARRDQAVTLYAVIVVNGAHFTDAPVLHVGGKPVTVRPLADAPAATLRWRKVEPVAQTMSNTETGEFHFETIAYQATPMPAASGRGAIAADVHPTLTPDHGNGVGTMRFQIEVAQGDRTIASAGVEARRGKGSGGLTDDVHRISLRRDDTYLGYLTELYGQPYIWASAGKTDRTHQSERLEGCDCADFVVYGRRRMGKEVAYTWTGALPAVTKLLAAGNRAADGVIRDDHGDPLPFTGVGDLILFPRHVGVLTEDREPLGILDDGDIMMHSLFDTPKEVPIRDSNYADTAIELRRWK